MQVSCPKCQLALKCPPERAGQQVRCPRCGQIVQLPASTAPSSDGPVAAPPLRPPVFPPPPAPPHAQEPAPEPFVPQLNIRSKSTRRSHGRSGSLLAYFLI